MRPRRRAGRGAGRRRPRAGGPPLTSRATGPGSRAGRCGPVRRGRARRCRAPCGSCRGRRTTPSARGSRGRLRREDSRPRRCDTRPCARTPWHCETGSWPEGVRCGLPPAAPAATRPGCGGSAGHVVTWPVDRPAGRPPGRGVCHLPHRVSGRRVLGSVWRSPRRRTPRHKAQHGWRPSPYLRPPGRRGPRTPSGRPRSAGPPARGARGRTSGRIPCSCGRASSRHF